MIAQVPSIFKLHTRAIEKLAAELVVKRAVLYGTATPTVR